MFLKLKGKRVEKGFTQKDVAKEIGIAVQTYNGKENGKIEFSVSECIAIMKMLDCTFEELFMQ